jgi:hypothetical protein
VGSADPEWEIEHQRIGVKQIYAVAKVIEALELAQPCQ